MDFKALEKIIKGLSPTHWSGQHNHFPLEEVTKIDVGLNLTNQKVWVSANFVERAQSHKLMGRMKAQETGKQGGEDAITLDGDALDHDDVTIGFHFSLFPPAAKIVLAFKYLNESKSPERYEFAGEIPLPLLGL